jgi:hypothetical protein
MLILEGAYESITDQTVAYTNPDDTRKFRQWLVGFVDDNSILFKMENLGYETHSREMVEKATKCLETWQRLVHISGGELELTKSSFAMMAWTLKGGKEVMCNMKEAPGSVKLRSDKYKGMQVELSRNEVSTAEKQLGVRLAMDGNDQEEFQFRLSQSKTLAGKVRASPFNRRDAEIIYRERWLPSVGYCLPITQFDDKQCKAIQMPFFNAVLHNM